MELYNEVSSKGDFEIIFVSADEDEDSFNGYFSKMPWLAIPFSDTDKRGELDELFEVQGIPHLVILDENGKVAIEDGTEVVLEYGIEAYPFTSERIKELKDQEEEAKRNQSLRSLLVYKSFDYVISSDGKQVSLCYFTLDLIDLKKYFLFFIQLNTIWWWSWENLTINQYIFLSLC